MLITIIFLILFILLIPTAYAAVIGAPIAVVSKSRVKEIMDIADIKPRDKFFELGTGTGRMMIAVAKNTDAKVIGFELSPIFYFITLLNLKLNNIKNYKLIFKDFFTANLKEANIIFCFLMPKTMEKLKGKFERELAPGTKIISFVFEIKGWIPYAMIKSNKKLPVYFYKIKLPV